MRLSVTLCVLYSYIHEQVANVFADLVKSILQPPDSTFFISKFFPQYSMMYTIDTIQELYTDSFLSLYPPFSVRWPPFLDLNDTSKLGLNHTYNFRIRTDEGHSLGVW